MTKLQHTIMMSSGLIRNAKGSSSPLNAALVEVGMSGNNVLFPEAVLKRDAAKLSGLRMYVDHATEEELFLRRGGRSIRDLAGVVTTAEFGQWTRNGQTHRGIVGTPRVARSAQWIIDLMDDGVYNGDLSLVALLSGEYRESDGAFVATSIDEGLSVDFVYEAAAGGLVLPQGTAPDQTELTQEQLAQASNLITIDTNIGQALITRNGYLVALATKKNVPQEDPSEGSKPAGPDVDPLPDVDPPTGDDRPEDDMPETDSDPDPDAERSADDPTTPQDEDADNDGTLDEIEGDPVPEVPENDPGAVVPPPATPNERGVNENPFPERPAAPRTGEEQPSRGTNENPFDRPEVVASLAAMVAQMVTVALQANGVVVPTQSGQQRSAQPPRRDPQQETLTVAERMGLSVTSAMRVWTQLSRTTPEPTQQQIQAALQEERDYLQQVAPAQVLGMSSQQRGEDELTPDPATSGGQTEVLARHGMIKEASQNGFSS